MLVRPLAARWLAAAFVLTLALGGCGRWGPPVRPVRPVEPGQTAETADTEADPEPQRSVFGPGYREDEPVPYIMEGLIDDGPDLDLEPEPEPDEPETDANPEKPGQEDPQSSE